MYNAGIIDQVDDLRHMWTRYEAAGLCLRDC